MSKSFTSSTNFGLLSYAVPTTHLTHQLALYFVFNDEVLRRTGLGTWSLIHCSQAKTRSFFGRVARLPDTLPANQILRIYTELGEWRRAAIAGMESCLWSAARHLDSPDLPWVRDTVTKHSGRSQRREASAERSASRRRWWRTLSGRMADVDARNWRPLLLSSSLIVGRSPLSIVGARAFRFALTFPVIAARDLVYGTVCQTESIPQYFRKSQMHVFRSRLKWQPFLHFLPPCMNGLYSARVVIQCHFGPFSRSCYLLTYLLSLFLLFQMCFCIKCGIVIFQEHTRWWTGIWTIRFYMTYTSFSDSSTWSQLKSMIVIIIRRWLRTTAWRFSQFCRRNCRLLPKPAPWEGVSIDRSHLSYCKLLLIYPLSALHIKLMFTLYCGFICVLSDVILNTMSEWMSEWNSLNADLCYSRGVYPLKTMTHIKLSPKFHSPLFPPFFSFPFRPLSLPSPFHFPYHILLPKSSLSFGGAQ